MSHLRKKPKKVREQTQPPKPMSYACGEPFKLLKCHKIHPISWMQIVFVKSCIICRIPPQSSNNDNTWGFCQGHTNCCKKFPLKMQNFVMTMYDCMSTRYS